MGFMLRDHDFNDYRGRRVTVMGLGSFGGGLGAVRFLLGRGALVTATDLRTEAQLAESLAQLADVPVDRWVLGRHEEADFDAAELVLVNPAVRRDHPLLVRCRERGIPLTSEMNLFWQHQRGIVLAVTGSNGKSTTTALLHNILRETGRRCWLGGNLGRSLLPVVDDIAADDFVVLELSSFQLADLDRLQVSPHVAVVTNFAPNHLDWHGTVDEYRQAKQTILRWQSATDMAVLNADDSDVRDWPVQGRRRLFGLSPQFDEGAFWDGDRAVIRIDSSEQRAPVRDWLGLPGRHNLANALGATAAAMAVGATLDHVRVGLETYQPLPHRLQFVGEAAGRKFYNDSLATTPESTLVALDAFSEPIVLLAGGYDKRVDLTAMAAGIATRTKAVALMGETATTLREHIQQQPQMATQCSDPLPDFVTAFNWALGQSAPGDVVVLSPGCASYDWFRNFADRGEQFTKLVRAWSASKDAQG
jgi:UDP-N-acetylmuramoylalanine--D-glutamate ligase